MVKLFYITSTFAGKWSEVKEILDNKKDAEKRLLHMAIFYSYKNYDWNFNFRFHGLTELSCDDCNRPLLTKLDEVYCYKVNTNTCICVDCIKSTKRKCDNPDYIRTNYQDIIDDALRDGSFEVNNTFVEIKEYGEIEIKRCTVLEKENADLKALVEHYKYKPPPEGQTEGGDGYEAAKKHYSKVKIK